MKLNNRLLWLNKIGKIVKNGMEYTIIHITVELFESW